MDTTGTCSNRLLRLSSVFLGLLLVFARYHLTTAFPNKIASRVVNGKTAAQGEYPYMVSLRTRIGTHKCGASIIAAKWVVTAAHCIDGGRPEDFTIQYGTNTITQNGPHIVHVNRLIVHQGYDEDKSLIHDIGLVQLAEPLQFNADVQPALLPDYLELVEGDIVATLIGWGFNNTGVLQSQLQKVDLITMTDDDCRQIHWDKVHKTNVCAGVQEGGKGQCTGDSGGPLIVDNKQVGIVSWSIKPCAVKGYPGVYTEMAYYVGWLREHTGISTLGRLLQ